MIIGAIDYIQILDNGRIRLGGWTCWEENNTRHAVDNIFALNLNFENVREVYRSDITADFSAGFNIDICSIYDLAALRFNDKHICASYKGNSSNLDIWEYLHEKIDNFLKDVLPLLKIPNSIKNCEILSEQDENQHYISRYAAKRDSIALHQSIIVQVGSISSDQEVTLGRDGQLFLMGGSNKVIQQYDRTVEENESQLWINTINQRQITCSQGNIKFIQMIVPEKQSIMKEHYIDSIEVPTLRLAKITTFLKDSSFYLDCFDVLRTMYINGVQPYKKTDSHLSHFGAEQIIKSILQMLQYELDIFPIYFNSELISGDIGGKLFNGAVYENYITPSYNHWDFAQIETQILDCFIPESGHGGIIYSWKSTRPLINKRVIIFGNSMFERGGESSGLSWWISRIFEYSIFIWSGSMSVQAIKEFSADIVICQTVERFLTHVPVDS